MISLDTETTGLDPQRHEVWEVGLVDLKTGAEVHAEFSVQHLTRADAVALQVNDYYKRAALPPGEDIATLATTEGFSASDVVLADSGVTGVRPEDAAYYIARFTTGQTLLGCNVAWDAQMLAELLKAYGVAPSWKHRYLELGSYFAGQRNLNTPQPTNAMARMFGEPDDPHTALGDARWNVEVYRNLIAQREERA